jgi:hypothetical protein
MIAKEMQAEMMANGRPSPARIRNAMSHPETFKMLKEVGLIPVSAQILLSNANPLKIELKVE